MRFPFNQFSITHKSNDMVNRTYSRHIYSQNSHSFLAPLLFVLTRSNDQTEFSYVELLPELHSQSGSKNNLLLIY